VKVISQTVLHYGSDYLGYALRSVIDHVDEAWVLYSAQGSHGHQTSLPCPDHASTLYDIAKQATGDKLRWYSASPGQWIHENQQREYIHTLAPDAEIILVVDSDEVYADGLAADAIAFAQTVQVRTIRLPFIHLWRSFKRGFAHDPAYPTRVIISRYADGEITMPTDKRVWHFGYSQRSEIVRYKIETHGHKNEWRKDIDWFNDRFMANAQQDCHPTNLDYWDCEDIDPSQLPSVLAEHPFANLGVIP